MKHRFIFFVLAFTITYGLFFSLTQFQTNHPLKKIDQKHKTTITMTNAPFPKAKKNLHKTTSKKPFKESSEHMPKTPLTTHNEQTNNTTTPSSTASPSTTHETHLPEPIQNIAPKYPPIALRNNIEGQVLVELTINPKGDVIKADIIQCNNPGYGFEEEAKKALSKATFKPIIRRGRPTTATLHYPISFVLIKKEPSGFKIKQ